jgi:O-antigen/teichoic acid export membrane protein
MLTRPWRTILVRGRAHVSDPLLRSAYSLGVNSILTAGLGMAFWILAARIYPSSSVGRDSALVAAMMQISTVAQLNLANALVRFMPGHATAGKLLVGAYVTSGVAAVLLGTAFVLVAPHVSEDFAFLTREPITGLVYVAAVVLWGVFALQDAALTAMRQAPWVPLENGVFGILKLIGLPLLFAIGSAHGVFVAWVIPMCFLLVPVNWLLFRRILSRHRQARANSSSALPFGRRRLASFLALDYLATVFIQTSLAVLPLLVVAILGSRANAHFYIPFTIAIAIDATSFSIATSLVAEGALAPDRVPALMRLLVRRVALVALPIVALLIVAAPLFMLPFGQEYVRDSTPVLRILVCATPFRAVVALVAAIWRVERSSGRIAALEGCILVGLVVTAIPLAHALGVIGVALAWLGSTMVAGCAVLPVLIGHFRSGADTGPRPPAAQPPTPPPPGSGRTL